MAGLGQTQQALEGAACIKVERGLEGTPELSPGLPGQ